MGDNFRLGSLADNEHIRQQRAQRQIMPDSLRALELRRVDSLRNVAYIANLWQQVPQHVQALSLLEALSRAQMRQKEEHRNALMKWFQARQE